MKHFAGVIIALWIIGAALSLVASGFAGYAVYLVLRHFGIV